MSVQELVSQSRLSASSTNPNTSKCFNQSCDVNNIKQTTIDDQATHLAEWLSDGSCTPQTITIDWSATAPPQSISGISILYDLSTKVQTDTVAFKTTSGTTVDVSNFLLCTRAQVDTVAASGGHVSLPWDICGFSSSATEETFTGIVGATFTFTPQIGFCQIGVHEIQIHGTQTPGSTQPNSSMSWGYIVMIVLVNLCALFFVGVCCLRQTNLRKRYARLLGKPTRGRYESLELWAADRAHEL
ncbi:hypothetical protein HDU98_012198 [Podochytrium sp. JEL0797]|nr:hypothetical protein HDU98_012198 [Podochytrium sp. JEL0797]